MTNLFQKIKLIAVLMILTAALPTRATVEQQNSAGSHSQSAQPLPDAYVQSQIEKMLSSLSALDSTPSSARAFANRFTTSFQSAEVLAEELDLHARPVKPAITTDENGTPIVFNINTEPELPTVTVIREAFAKYIDGIDKMGRKIWAIENPRSQPISDTTWEGLDLLGSDINKELNKRWQKYVATLNKDEIQSEIQKDPPKPGQPLPGFIIRTFDQALENDHLLALLTKVSQKIAPTYEELTNYDRQAVYSKRARTAEKYISYMALTTSAFAGVVLQEWLASAAMFYFSLKIKNGLPIPDVNQKQKSLALVYYLHRSHGTHACAYYLTRPPQEDSIEND